MTDLETAFLDACTGDPEPSLHRIAWLDSLLVDLDGCGFGEQTDDPSAYAEALHHCRDLARLLHAAVHSAIEPDNNPEHVATPAKPDLALLPEPIRERITAALAQREREQAERQAEFERKAAERWLSLTAAVTQDLDAVLLPFANIHKRPDDWTGEEVRRAVTIQLKGLAPIVANYVCSPTPARWERHSDWNVNGRSHADLNAALLAAYDCTIEPPPF